MVNCQNGHFEFNFVVKFQVDHFDHGKFGFLQWSWSKSLSILRFRPWSWLQNDHGTHTPRFPFGYGQIDVLTIDNFDFGHDHGQNF